MKDSDRSMMVLFPNLNWPNNKLIVLITIWPIYSLITGYMYMIKRLIGWTV